MTDEVNLYQDRIFALQDCAMQQLNTALSSLLKQACRYRGRQPHHLPDAPQAAA